MLDPIKPALILPEVTDPTKRWEGKQKYADNLWAQGYPRQAITFLLIFR